MHQSINQVPSTNPQFVETACDLALYDVSKS